MPLFTSRLNLLWQTVWYLVRFSSTCIQTAPSDASPANGRTTAGGGGYENGISVAAADWSAAAAVAT